MKHLWRNLSLGLGLVALALLGAGCGGGGAANFSPQSSLNAAGTGSVAFTVPPAGGATGRGAAKVPGTAKSLYLALYGLYDDSQEQSSSHQSYQLTKSVELTSQAQDVVISNVPEGLYQAYLQARDANGQTVASRTTYLYVKAGSTVNVLAQLGYTDSSGIMQPSSTNAITYSQGDHIALDHTSPQYTVTSIQSGQTCGLTLGYQGYLVCGANGTTYLIQGGSSLSGTVQSGTGSAPVGLGIFRGGLRPGQIAEAIVFSSMSGATHTLNWGDGTVDTVTPGQRVTHTYAGAGYYRVTATATISAVGRAAESTSTYSAEGAITVMPFDSQGAGLYARTGQTVAVTSTAISVASGGAISVSGSASNTSLVVSGASTGEGLAALTGTNPTVSQCTSATYQSSVSFTSSLSFASQYYCYKLGSVGPVLLKVVSAYVATNVASDGIPGEVGMKLVGSNTAPVITSATSVSGTVGQAFTYTATATDADGDSVSFTFSGLPSWATATGATVTGTPTSAGSVQFSILASDGKTSTSATVSGTIAAASTGGGTGTFSTITTIAGQKGVSGSATAPLTFNYLGDVENLPNGNLMVHDSGNNRLVEITTAGAFVQSRTATDAEDFAVDSAGNLYYIAYSTGFQPPFTLHKITTAGADSVLMTLPSGETFQGLTVDSSGFLYTMSQPSPYVQSASTTIHKITPQGVGSTFATIDNSTVNNCPVDLEVDGSGNLYVLGHCSNKLFKYSSAGMLTNTYTNAAWSSVRPLEIDSAGNAYIGSYGTTTFDAYQITPAGVITQVFSAPQAAYNQPSVDGAPGTATLHAAYGFTFGSDGSVYLTDGSDYTVRKITFP